MGLSEPVSGSHVASAPGPAPPFSFPPPHCSHIPPTSDPTSSSQVNPSPTPPPPSSAVPSPDPAPVTAPAPSSGAIPPPVSFPRPDLAPDLCSAANHHLFPSLQASATPPSSRSVPPSPTSSSAGFPSSSGGSAPASHGPSMDPAALRVVTQAPNPPCHPSSSQILSDPLPSASISAPNISGQGLPPPILSSLPRSLTSGRSSGVAPPLSYAQAARGPRGPGFVRSHAADVESFARLPRTGINIICGSREGAPSFSFVSSDLPKVEEIYSNALVMRFLGGRPSLEASHKEILNWGIEKPFSIGPMSSRAFLLRFQDSKDLVKVLSRPSSTLITFPYRVFRWHNQCHIKEDSCFAPVWISLPKLPLQCFIPEFLEAVANKIGRFLCFDKATATLARPSVARMCVELDLRKNQPPFIWVGLFEGFKQSVIYERLPKFCSKCLSQGHTAPACPWGQRETLPIQTHPHTVHVPDRPLDVRRNASKRPHAVPQPHSRSASFNDLHSPLHQSFTVPTSPSNPPITSDTSQPSTRDQAEASQYAAPPPARVNAESINLTAASPSEQLHPSGPIPAPHPAVEALSDPTLTDVSPLACGIESSSVPAATTNSQPSLSHIQRPNPPSTDILNAPHSSGLPDPLGSHPVGTSSVQHIKSSNRKGKKKKKSVSFQLPDQSNLTANREFWNAVSSHIAKLDQGPPKHTDAPLMAPVTVGEVQASSNSLLLPLQDQCGDDSSASSIAADSPPLSPYASHRPLTYASEGEETITERSPMLGHCTDDLLLRRTHHSKKNKRHPDQPLKVQLRFRKDPSSTTQ